MSVPVLSAPQPFGPHGVCLALGLFDGVHLGHQHVVRQAKIDARARGAATVPTQALTMMNSPFVRSAAEGLAKRVIAADPQASDAAAIDSCFTAALSRPPSDAERDGFVKLLASRGGDGGPAARQAALADACHLIFCLNEFIYVD
jgi:hypothetical protein